MHQFKDKSAREQQLVRTSLFLYPVLQAADILLYKTDEVPVGDDQRQHVELAREIARRFNSTYARRAGRARARDPRRGRPDHGPRRTPTAKMSTSYGSEAGLVYIDDEPDAILRKLKRAETDSGREIVRAPDKPGVSQPDRDPRRGARQRARAELEGEFEGQRLRRPSSRRWGRPWSSCSRPVRERYRELRPDEEGLERTLAAGAERAREIARATMAEVREAMGIGPAR